MKTLILNILFLLILTSCGGGTTTGNPVSEPVNVRMEDQQPFALLKKSWDMFLPSAFANASSVKFCFKRLRFKPDSSTSGSNFDLTLGEVTIDPAGTNLLTVNVPRGTYGRIEFDLEKECDGTPGKPSVSFTNGASYSTQDHITIKFDGTFVVSAASTVTLDIDALLDALDTVANDNEIKTKLETATGDF